MQTFESAPLIKINKRLNPKIWKDNQLRSDVRNSLLEIAQDFLKFVDIPVNVIDIQITGGNANYNYTRHSDLDLHIISDFSNVQCDREVAELFDSKRLLYRELYVIKIFGIPVELYIEDKDHPAVSSSYSVVKNKWIKPPSRIEQPYDIEEVERMVKVWTLILQNAMKTGDRHQLQNVLKLLRAYRQLGLKRSGEFSIPNLVYKSLRNNKTIHGLFKLLNKLHDQELSLK
jgi:hypothetical protein